MHLNKDSDLQVNCDVIIWICFVNIRQAIKINFNLCANSTAILDER